MSFLTNISSAFDRIHFHNLQTDLMLTSFDAHFSTFVDKTIAYDVKIAVRHYEECKYFGGSRIFCLYPENDLPSKISFDLSLCHCFLLGSKIDTKTAHAFIRVETEKVSQVMKEFLQFYSNNWVEIYNVKDEFDELYLNTVLQMDNAGLKFLEHQKNNVRDYPTLKRFIKKFKFLHKSTITIGAFSGWGSKTVCLYGEEEILEQFIHFLKNEAVSHPQPLSHLVKKQIAMNMDHYKDSLDVLPTALRKELDFNTPWYHRC